MEDNYSFIDIDTQLIDKIIKKRDDHRFENVYSDAVLFEMQELKDNRGLSLVEIVFYLKEKHGIDTSTSYVCRVSKFLKKRAKKQDIFTPTTPDSAQYPIYIKRPTKTPKKDTLDSENLSTVKDRNTLHPINESDGQKGVPKSFEDLPEIDDISVSSMVDEFLAEDEVEVLGNESLIAAKEDKNEEIATQEDGDFEIDAILEQGPAPEKIKPSEAKNIANNKNDNQNKNDKKEQSRSVAPTVDPGPGKKEPKGKEPVLSDDDSLVCDIIGRPSSDQSRLSAERNRSLERYERKKFLIKKKRSEEGITDDEKHELWDLTVVRYDYAPETIDVEPI